MRTLTEIVLVAAVVYWLMGDYTPMHFVAALIGSALSVPLYDYLARRWR